MSTRNAAAFAASFAALYAAHELADHWVQTNDQAIRKGQRVPEGQRACAGHVATLTTTKALALAVTSRALGLRLSPRRVALALAGDAKAAPCGTGAYALDQAAHVAMLWAAALIIAGGERSRT